jgi:hypothetical protein
MNQRRELRFPVDQPVEVVVLGPSDVHFPCRVRNASGRGIGLEVPEPLATGMALRINLVDTILLGEVIYCRAQDGGWYAGVELEHAIYGLAELANATRGFVEENLGREHPHSLHHTGRKDEQ